jgi:CHAD domain
MHALSAARDVAALAESAKSAAKDAKKKKRAALGKVARNLDAAQNALAPLPLDAVRKGLRDLLALAQVWPAASTRQIVRGAERVARRARRACRRGAGSRKPALRHQWRKREKDRFYAADILEQSWPKRRGKRAGRAEKLGHALGRERDTLLLIARIEAEPALAGDLPSALKALEVLHARTKRLAARSDDLGAKLHRGRA